MIFPFIDSFTISTLILVQIVFFVLIRYQLLLRDRFSVECKKECIENGWVSAFKCANIFVYNRCIEYVVKTIFIFNQEIEWKEWKTSTLKPAFLYRQQELYFISFFWCVKVEPTLVATWVFWIAWDFKRILIFHFNINMK